MMTAPPVSQTRVFVSGVVEHGDQRGRLLGFPTANIGVSADSISPADAVYAGYVHRSDSAVSRAAVSLGRRPTFYSDRGLHLLEAHLLDFDGDLYDQILTVELVRKLRDQIRFDGPDQLVRQLARDVSECRSVLDELPHSGR